MQPKFTPLAGGKWHVELDWRPGETGYFTRHEMMRLAIALLQVADPKGVQAIASLARASMTAPDSFRNAWTVRACGHSFSLQSSDIPPEDLNK
jgi:hypothetical protein